MTSFSSPCLFQHDKYVHYPFHNSLLEEASKLQFDKLWNVSIWTYHQAYLDYVNLLLQNVENISEENFHILSQIITNWKNTNYVQSRQ